MIAMHAPSLSGLPMVGLSLCSMCALGVRRIGRLVLHLVPDPPQKKGVGGGGGVNEIELTINLS